VTASEPAGVCVVGSVNVDTTLRVATLPGAGQTVLARGRTTSHGGKGANQAVAAASQGGTVHMVAAVGNDDPGRSSVDRLAARGVEIGSVRILDEAPTGSAIVLVADDSENLIVVDQGANRALDGPWVSEHVAKAAPDVVLAQLEIPITSVLAAAQAWNPRYFVLNPAPMPADVASLQPLLEHVDVLVPNRPELAEMVGQQHAETPEDIDRCAERLAFPGTLVVTLGRQGALVYGPYGRERLAHVPAAHVEAVDTTGAGDAFCGVMADRLARRSTVVDAVKAATRFAGLSTTVHGAQVPEFFAEPRRRG
jgi:ribokinase